MEQTLKYIKVLNWGYGAFAPMTISPDFEESYKQVTERLQLLDSLNYGTLLSEATSPEGKACLDRYTKTDITFEYGLHFLRDRDYLLSHTPSMLKCFHDEADKFCKEGTWTNEQWQEYRGTLGAITRGFEERLKQFITAYDYLFVNEPGTQPSFMQIEKVVHAFERGVKHGYMTKQDGKYKWIKDKGTLLCALIGTLLHGDEIGTDGDYKTKGGAETFPASDIEKYFGLKDISKKRYQLNQKKPPRGYKEMIKILIEQP